MKHLNKATQPDTGMTNAEALASIDAKLTNPIFTAGAAQTYTFDYPDGFECAAGTGIAVGVIGEDADGVTAAAVGKVMIAIEGFEY